MENLTTEQKMFTLAYAGLPALQRMMDEHQEIPIETKHRAMCIYFLADIAFSMKVYAELPDDKIDKNFRYKQMSELFDALVTDGPDDPRDIRLLTDLMEGFLAFTDSGMETYADFDPFHAFEHPAWRDLVLRMRSKKSLDHGLKDIVERFITKGFHLILVADLLELHEPHRFFAWFEPFIPFNQNEKMVTRAMKYWKGREDDGDTYCMSGEYSERWYSEGLKFMVTCTSPGFVSKIFAEQFKEAHPELYEKFRVLAGLEPYEIPKPDPDKEKDDRKEHAMEVLLKEMFGRYVYTPERLVEKLLEYEAHASLIVQIMFAIVTDPTDDDYDHTRKTMVELISKHPDSLIIRFLDEKFDIHVKEKIEDGTLCRSDVPPSRLYLTDSGLHWLFNEQGITTIPGISGIFFGTAESLHPEEQVLSAKKIKIDNKPKILDKLKKRSIIFDVHLDREYPGMTKRIIYIPMVILDCKLLFSIGVVFIQHQVAFTLPFFGFYGIDFMSD